MKATRTLGGEDYPLRDQVSDEIRNRISDARLAPGERLVEQTLADEFHVSRVPIREALRTLQAEGFVTMIPRQGAFVTQLSRSDLEHLYDVRSALEELAFRRAAENATTSEIDHLRRLVEQTSAAAHRGDHNEATRLNAEFHETVIDASGNPYLSSTYASLTGRLRWLINQSREYERHVSEHSALINAIAERDVERAGELAAAHIITGRAHGLQQYDEATDGQTADSTKASEMLATANSSHP